MFVALVPEKYRHMSKLRVDWYEMDDLCYIFFSPSLKFDVTIFDENIFFFDPKKNNI